MRKLVIICIFISFHAFSKENNSRFPLRLKSLQLHYASYEHGLDIVNMFSDHLRIEPQEISNFYWSFDIRIMSFLDLLYSQETFSLKFPQTSKYILDEYEYEYDKKQYGFRLHLNGVAIEFGSGFRQFHSFIETDTFFYFHRKLQVPFSFMNFNYTYPTSLHFDLNLFYEQVFFNSVQSSDMVVDEGDQKSFGIRFIFGTKYQIVPFVSHSYTNIKLIHRFFGLKNEINNKFYEQKLGLSLIYNY